MRSVSIGRFLERIVPAALGLALACLIVPTLLQSHREGDTLLAVACSIGVTLGVIARVSAAPVARGASVAAAWLAVVFCAVFIVESLIGPEGVRSDTFSIARAVTTCVVLAVVLAGWPWRRRLAGFAVALSPFAFLMHSTTLLLIAGFLFARDVSAADREAPARQSLALLGVGALMMCAASGLGFDIGVQLDSGEMALSRSWIDGPATRWPRMTAELVLLAACAAQLRGRSAGVLAVAPLWALLAFLARGPLPGYGSGCIWWGHPLGSEMETPFLIAGVVAVLPWIVPMLRALRAPAPRA